RSGRMRCITDKVSLLQVELPCGNGMWTLGSWSGNDAAGRPGSPAPREAGRGPVPYGLTEVRGQLLLLFYGRTLSKLYRACKKADPRSQFSVPLPIPAPAGCLPP